MMSLPDLLRADAGCSSGSDHARPGRRAATRSWPVVVLVHDRLDVRAAHLGRGVHVGEETDHRDVGLGAWWPESWRRHSRCSIHLDVVQAQAPPARRPAARSRSSWPGRAGKALGVLAGLRVDRHVLQEPLDAAGLVLRFGHRPVTLSCRRGRRRGGMSRLTRSLRKPRARPQSSADPRGSRANGRPCAPGRW